MTDVSDDTFAVEATRNDDDRLFEFLSRHLGRMLLPSVRGKSSNVLCTELVFQRPRCDHSNPLNLIKLSEGQRGRCCSREHSALHRPRRSDLLPGRSAPFSLGTTPSDCLPACIGIGRQHGENDHVERTSL
jgi:hypothetical protein